VRRGGDQGVWLANSEWGWCGGLPVGGSYQGRLATGGVGGGLATKKGLGHQWGSHNASKRAGEMDRVSW
jgi:hypothetical protein